MSYFPLCTNCGAQHAADVICRAAVAEWVAKTCLTFGSQVSTAYQVAGLFVAQLEQDDRAAADSRGQSG